MNINQYYVPLQVQYSTASTLVGQTLHFLCRTCVGFSKNTLLLANPTPVEVFEESEQHAVKYIYGTKHP